MSVTDTHLVRAEPVTEHGVLRWFITFGSIGLWLVHIGAEAALVGYSDHHRWVLWVMNGLTIVLAALALLTTLLSWHTVRRHDHDESHMSPQGRTVFVGWLGVFIGAVNVLLIVVEGIYIVVLNG
jgi:membrane protein implicated in regulation of membrane protease activity